MLLLEKHGDIFSPYAFVARGWQVKMQLFYKMAGQLAEKIQPHEYIRVWDRPHDLSVMVARLYPKAHRSRAILMEVPTFGNS